MDEVEVVRCRLGGIGVGSVGGGDDDEGKGYAEAVVNDDTSGGDGDKQVCLGTAGHMNRGIKEE
jgi:hypothetical protein